MRCERRMHALLRPREGRRSGARGPQSGSLDLPVVASLKRALDPDPVQASCRAPGTARHAPFRGGIVSSRAMGVVAERAPLVAANGTGSGRRGCRCGRRQLRRTATQPCADAGGTSEVEIMSFVERVVSSNNGPSQPSVVPTLVVVLTPAVQIGVSAEQFGGTEMQFGGCNMSSGRHSVHLHWTCLPHAMCCQHRIRLHITCRRRLPRAHRAMQSPPHSWKQQRTLQPAKVRDADQSLLHKKHTVLVRVSQ